MAFRYHIKPVADLESSLQFSGWHTFRRSFASVVVGSTKGAKAAQELMRYSTSKLTLDLYAQHCLKIELQLQKQLREALCYLRLRPECGQCTEEHVKLNGVNPVPVV